MNCPQCGGVCHCSPESAFTASMRWTGKAENSSSLPAGVSSTPVDSMERQLVDPEGADPSAQKFTAGLESANSTRFADQPEIEPEVAEGDSQRTAEQDGNTPSGEDTPAWRDEVAARLNRYRARRKPRPPRYPSLRLRFEPEESFRDFTSSSGDASPVAPAVFENVSDRALALDRSTATDRAPLRAEGAATECLPLTAAASSSGPSARQSHSGARIIEFPRSTTLELPTLLDELAEPVIEGPRILEAPELAPAPAPALGGITIETVEQKEIERSPGIDFPLQSAPLARRIVAAALDGAIIAAASALFAFIFWEITGLQPPRFQILGLAAGIPWLLWATYQYVLIVYSGSTPGLRLAGLEVTYFDGSRPNRSRRRWRVLACYLSAISLGMGYAWFLLDEDALCWHDRITHTYLAPKKRQLNT